MHEPLHTDRLYRMLEAQRELQRSMPPLRMDPDKLEGMDRIRFFMDMKLALESELQEMLDEMGWKPWATSRHFNTEAVKGEIIDAWHFLMNMWLAAGGDAEEFFEYYNKKREKNLKRQQAPGGYDGVSTKCPVCKRALDDTAVDCNLRPAQDGQPPAGWCGKREEVYTLDPYGAPWFTSQHPNDRKRTT